MCVCVCVYKYVHTQSQRQCHMLLPNLTSQHLKVKSRSNWTHFLLWYISLFFPPLWVVTHRHDGFKGFFLGWFHRQGFISLSRMPKSSRTDCSYIAESVCMSDCTHSIVSRCVRSPLQPYHFCPFLSLCSSIPRWPPPLHPALMWIFLSDTSCVSSRSRPSCCRTPICNTTGNSCVCAFAANNSGSAGDVEGCLQASAAQQEPKASFKWKHPKTRQDLMSFVCHLLQLACFFTTPPFVSPVFP